MTKKAYPNQIVGNSEENYIFAFRIKFLTNNRKKLKIK